MRTGSKSSHELSRPALALAVACLSSGCVNRVSDDPETGLAAAVVENNGDASAVIVGSLNWVETTTLAAGSPERASADRVGYLSIPARGTRCTAFLVAPDLVMTNEHCVSSQAHAEGATVSFRRELGVPWSEMQTYACGTFVGDDATLDYALLRCAGAPGASLGVVELETSAPPVGSALYVVHQNCDYYTTPGCDPTKKLSPGQVTGSGYQDLHHDADTLGGSSGSPVFSSSSHRVFALHHVGIGGNASGRGSYNGAVPMAKIVAHIEATNPSVVLGVDAAPAAPIGDGFEPNDSVSEATSLGGSMSADGLAITAGDVDVFRFDVAAGARLAARVDFAHAAGDLDMTLHRGSTTSPAIARSDSTADFEAIVVESTAADAYFVVIYGYNGATNAYDLVVTID